MSNSQESPQTQKTRDLLSSRSTDFTRRFLPWINLAAVLLVLVIFYFERSGAPDSRYPPTSLLPFILIIGSMGTAYSFRWCKRLKHVALEGDLILVADFADFRDALIIRPEDIKKISENRWNKNRVVILHLQSQTKYGEQIHFIPYNKLRFIWQKHPAVTTLEDLMNSKAGHGKQES